jgi:cytochrome c-type biogenesis protein CcmH
MRKMQAARQAGVLTVLLAALALAPVGAASAATPRANISEVEAEVMCPVCGTLLELADSPQARREKAFVAKLIAAGKTKEEIKDALVVQYGPDVLAVPEGSGFDLSAYLVPLIAFLIAIVALAIGVVRWRRRPDSPEPKQDPPTGPDDEDAKRLDADIARYDL